MYSKKLEKCLNHPLFLLLIGALISYYLIPSWTRKWQDRQKELELKVSLMREISESFTEMISKIETTEVSANQYESVNPTKDESDPNQVKEKQRRLEFYLEKYNDMQSYYLKWIVKRDVLGSNIKAFFPYNNNLVKEYTNLCDMVYYLEALSEKQWTPREGRKEVLEKIQDCLPESKRFPDLDKLTPRTLDNWMVLKEKANAQKDEIFRKISESRISTF